MRRSWRRVCGRRRTCRVSTGSCSSTYSSHRAELLGSQDGVVRSSNLQGFEACIWTQGMWELHRLLVLWWCAMQTLGQSWYHSVCLASLFGACERCRCFAGAREGGGVRGCRSNAFHGVGKVVLNIMFCIYIMFCYRQYETMMVMSAAAAHCWSSWATTALQCQSWRLFTHFFTGLSLPTLLATYVGLN